MMLIKILFFLLLNLNFIQFKILVLVVFHQLEISGILDHLILLVDSQTVDVVHLRLLTNALVVAAQVLIHLLPLIQYMMTYKKMIKNYKLMKQIL